MAEDRAHDFPKNAHYWLLKGFRDRVKNLIGSFLLRDGRLENHEPPAPCLPNAITAANLKLSRGGMTAKRRSGLCDPCALQYD
jgi:hypothetical protein